MSWMVLALPLTPMSLLALFPTGNQAFGELDNLSTGDEDWEDSEDKEDLLLIIDKSGHPWPRSAANTA